MNLYLEWNVCSPTIEVCFRFIPMLCGSWLFHLEYSSSCGCCLTSHNRIFTRDNLKKRSDVSDPTCLFCNELESITHLFFDCCVAVNVWKVVTEVIDVNIGSDYESIARLWVANKIFFIANVISSAILWSLWKLRNEICFQGMVWTGMRMVHDQNCKDVKGLAFAV